MLEITEEVFNQLVEHAKRDLPFEACGYMGFDDNVIKKAIPLKNVDSAHDHFSFEPQEQFSAIKALRKGGLKPNGIYHSHPSTPARPSEEDIKLAMDPNINYFILSLADEKPDLKVFRIKGEDIEKIELKIING